MNCNKASITQNTVNLWNGIRQVITVLKFTVLCVTLALFQVTSSRYSVWCLFYHCSYVHGILCDACLITVHKFTVFCVMLDLLQFICSRYSVWCLTYYSSYVHGILCDACLITMNCNKASITQNTVNKWTVIRQASHRILWTCDLE
jgi:hypothetical protein